MLDSLSRAWYSASLSEFLVADPKSVLGALVSSGTFQVLPSQRDAWEYQIALLQSALAGFATGSIYFEFVVPRMGKRIDTVLIIGAALFVIEFKVGEVTFTQSAKEQVWDYALDLKNFHAGSHAVAIFPVVAISGTESAPSPEYIKDSDQVYRPLLTTGSQVRDLIREAVAVVGGSPIAAAEWASSPYKPTPTIIEAAQALYSQHSVDAITRNDAGDNLAVTSRRLETLIDQARGQNEKIICLVTGVPGAGKTLVGLNVATRRSDPKAPTHAVFLSGNDPLVKVLTEALAQDEFARKEANGEAFRKGSVRSSVKSFIQIVHHFRDEGLRDNRAPPDRVVIFDEAQRAWTLKKTRDFMKRKRGLPDFNQSEPAFLISCMDRHPDWSAIICLVGGGQEINDGEAGISAWIEAVIATFPDWHLHISSKLTDTEYGAGHVLEAISGRPNTHLDDALHLSVSMRSYRAESLSAFVKAVLDLDDEAARRHLRDISPRFPLALTRDLSVAKKWIHSKARGSERYGLVTSSKAQRLKPHAIDVRVKIDPVHWFLKGKDDTRSSYYLEDAATEFQVQGLELDWTCVTWDADFRRTGEGWSHHDFRGSRWTNIGSEADKAYLKNAYRVLLTRARQGMIIFVPDGDPGDPTRKPEYYEATYRYLSGLGLPTIA